MLAGLLDEASWCWGLQAVIPNPPNAATVAAPISLIASLREILFAMIFFIYVMCGLLLRQATCKRKIIEYINLIIHSSGSLLALTVRQNRVFSENSKKQVRDDGLEIIFECSLLFEFSLVTDATFEANFESCLSGCQR